MTPLAGRQPRRVSQRWLAQGVDAQRDHRLKDAVAFYSAAARSDPSYLEAETSLGSAAMEFGDIPQALRAYEMALMIKPDSFDARFNFGLALKRAN